MENIAILFNQTQILERQKEIRQEVGRARTSSKALSKKLSQTINSIEFLFEESIGLLINRKSQTKKGGLSKTAIKN